MKLRFLLIAALILSSLLPAKGAFATSELSKHTSEAETDQVIITMKKGEGLENKDVEGLQSLNEEQGLVYSAKVPEGEQLQEYIEEMEALPGVEKVEPDYLMELTYTPNDPNTTSDQYHHAIINSYDAWDLTTGASEVQVAVLDNGFDIYHLDLYRKWSAYYWTTSSFSVEEHGTHVAGIIGASMNNNYQGTGVAPNVSLVPIDVFEMERQAYTSDIIEGIYLAANLDVDVINMSLGGYNYSSSYNDAIQYAHQQGIVIVAAAGNDGSMQTMYPAGYENVLSVASTDRYNDSSYFSNYGYTIDIAAPGSSIWSTTPYNGFLSMSGTSMAAPVVAGVAALVKSSEPTLTNTEIVDRLIDSATDVGSTGKDIFYGHGIVNAAAALGIVHIPEPIINYVGDQTTQLMGTLLFSVKNATVTVSNDSGVIGSTTNYSGWSDFTVTIPKQKAGSYLSVAITDEKGNVSDAASVYVFDETPPAAPKVNSVTDKSTAVTGTSEVNTSISVWQNGNEIGFGFTDTNGKFNIPITPFVVGTELYIEAADYAGNVSKGVYVTVKDGTAPAKPVVNQVTDQSTQVTGKAEAASKVEIRKDAVVIGQGQATKEGTFSITIPKQVGNTKLTVVAIDGALNSSAPVEVIVVDTVAPAKPTINEISDLSVAVSGKSEPNAKIEVVKDKKILASGTASAKGDFSIAIAKQVAGTSIGIVAIDAAGNRSEMTTIKVVDKTIPTLSEVSKVTSSSTTLSGKTEAGATVTLLNGTKEVAKGIANQSGVFALTFAPQPSQSELVLVAKDAAGNVSSSMKIVVSSQQQYTDLASSHWAYKQIMYLANTSIIGGYPDGTFQPERKTTRAEAARMLASALNLEVIDSKSVFKDVPSTHWANNYIVATAKAGIFNGNPDGTFNPNGKLTRAEMAKLLSTAYELNAKNPARFSDVKSTHWANKAIASMHENNLTTGYPDGTYRPNNPTTRAEFSMFLARAINKEFR